MSLPARAPSRQTGAICIRHYDDGHNPYSDVKQRMAEAVANPNEQCNIKERFLLKHIAEAKAAEERKRALADSRKSPKADGQSPSLTPRTVDGTKPNSPSHMNYLTKLRAHLNHIDTEVALGNRSISDHHFQSLDGALYLEWELECKRCNDSQRWEDAIASELDIPMCGTFVPYGLAASLMQDDGKVPLHSLLKALYGHLTDDALSQLVIAADRQRPIPLSFSSARALHRYFAEIIKRFSKSSKISQRSNKAGLDQSEFQAFCHNVRVMSDKEAARVFAELAVEATNPSVGRVFTADEFAAYCKM